VDAAGAGTGDPKIAGPVSSSFNCVDALDIAQIPATLQAPDRRARHDSALQTVAVLAELYPAAIVAERWQPHRPLKIGIRDDLIATGLLTPTECKAALRLYIVRLQYQKALAAGGPRFDLDGNPAGEVAPDEAEHARAAVAHLEALSTAKAEAARRAAAERRRARRKDGGSPP
jgi:sRNA-binding protein